MNNKNILFISYVFPPTGGAGIQRTVKLVKYFKMLNWQPYVLTVKNPSVPVFDYQLLQDIPRDVKIFKSYSWEIPYSIKQKLWRKAAKPGLDKDDAVTDRQKNTVVSWVKRSLAGIIQQIMIPDPQIGWVGSARKMSKKIVKKHDIQTIFISAPPFSSLLIGTVFSDSDVRVISDFRDEWSEFYLKSYEFHKRENKTFAKILQFEKEVIEKSDLVTMATSSFVDNYRHKYPDYAAKIKVLTNGFDEEDFDKARSNTPKEQNRKFRICYTGTVFNVTTARYFLSAMELLLSKQPDLANNLEVKFVGRITEDEKEFFENFIYPDVLECVGYVDHDKSIEFLMNSDLLLVIVDELDGAARIIAAKVFEYINAGAPILALVPENGEIAKIIKETNTGKVISNRNIDKISAALEGFVKNKPDFKPNRDKINKYSRKNLASKLINYITTLG